MPNPPRKRTIKQCAVVGGGIIGVAVARELCQQTRRRPGHRLRKGRPARGTPDRAQLGRGPCGPLLRARRTEGKAVPQGSGAAAGILRREEPSLRGLREVGHRPDAGGIGRAWTPSSPGPQPTASPEHGCCSGEQIREVEPNAVGLSALHSPETAIVDYTAITEALADDVRSHRAGPSGWGRKCGAGAAGQRRGGHHQGRRGTL